MADSSLIAEAVAIPIANHQQDYILPPTQPNYHHRYEILPNLWAQLREDAIVTSKNLGNGRCELTVRTDGATLGDYLFIAENFCMRAILVRGNDGVTCLRDLDVSMDRLLVDPLVDREEAAAFLDLFGCVQPPSKQEEPSSQPNSPENNKSNISITNFQHTLPKRRLTQDEWDQFLQNVRNDTKLPARPTNLQERSNAATDNQRRSDDVDSKHSQSLEVQVALNSDTALGAKVVDIPIPSAKVCAVRCKVSNGKGSPTEIAFPVCVGSANCTLRSLLQYYCASILTEMDIREGKKARIDFHTTTSDITGVGGSLVGAAVGGVMLGPVGYVAGSVVGSQFGKRNSTSIAGAYAGAVIFGPIGLVAGACHGASSSRNVNREEGYAPTAKMDASSTSTPQTIKKAASEHIDSKKYEYGGSTGVIAGATIGAATLGPIGLVTGAYLGSVSGRKIVESASKNAERRREGEESGRYGSQYRFGDITRGVVSRGKESRGASGNEGYQFGDFTRGLFNRGKGK